MMVAITSLLVAGITSTTMQADAFKSKNSQKGTNFCYRSDGCDQSNIGQQASGKNNKLVGFTDQSTN